MQDPKVFNQALESVSPAYKAYAATKLKGWNNFTCESQQQKDFSSNSAIATATPAISSSTTSEKQQQQPQQQYSRPRVILGTSDDYASHYEQYLNPKLEDKPLQGRRRRRYFLDFGAAPGGMCKSLLQRWNKNDNRGDDWHGTAVTLGPSEGGLPMDDDMLLCASLFLSSNLTHEFPSSSASPKNENDHFSNRLVVKYRDVSDADVFINSCTLYEKNTTNDQDDDSAAPSSSSVVTKNDHWADFVNCGIVLDAKVKSKKTGKVIGYGEQLFIQLMAGVKALRSDGEGDVMVALRFDFPSLPESIPTIDLFARHATKGVFILPTLYTESAGRKQFYLLARGIVLTSEFCQDVKNIWDKGRERYVNFKKEILSAREAAKNQNSSSSASTNNNIRQREEDDEGEKKKIQDEGTQQNDTHNDADDAKVFEMVKRVYAACGPTLDEFCGIIQRFLERNFDEGKKE